MRGKVRRGLDNLNADGITPAYAGKRSASCGHVEAVRDHPRLCGEKRFLPPLFCAISGSPPPMRGKGPAAFPCRPPQRITPAYAGKSLQNWTMQVTKKDHPRLCGEKVSHVDLTYLELGSPPPMRGKDHSAFVPA